MLRRTLLLTLVLAPALAASPLAAAPPPAQDAWCGTSETLLSDVLARHDLNQRRLERQAPQGAFRALSAAAPTVRAEGDVAVIEDDGTIVTDRNLVDLPANFGVRFNWKKKKALYKARRNPGGINRDFGNPLDLGDDDSARVNLPFQVRFYGTRYSRLFVHSDGNVTFEEADAASTARDIGRLLGGPPRIAPFFADLDPSSSGGVFVRVLGNAVRVTWNEVPEFGLFNENTFQMTIFKNGKILFALGTLEADVGVVGLSPGRGALLDALDLTEDLPAKNLKAAVAENFSNEINIDEAQLAKVFLEKFKDQYHTIVIFADFNILLLGNIGTVAYEFTVNNAVRGIGQPVFNAARAFGSSGPLESIVNMGAVSKYQRNVSRRQFFDGFYSPIDINLHEFGHRWLSFVSFRKAGKARSDDLLGRGSAHWNFHHDVDGSFMEGSEIEDNGDGTFTTQLPQTQYSDLDLYLMGILPPGDVGDFFYVSPTDASRAPEAGALLVGDKVTVSVQDVIRAESARRPAAATADKQFRVAYVLVTKDGQAATPAAIEHVDDFRREAVAKFRRATRGLGRLNTTLDEKE